MTNKQQFLSGTDVVGRLIFEGLGKKYILCVLINIIIIYTILILLPLCLFLFDDFEKRNILFALLEIIIVMVGGINIAITRKACAFKGYAIREMDITYRTGIIFPKVTTIPFCKIQQVAIKQSPISRLFSLYSVEITNGAQFESAIEIPGLTEEKAEMIKKLLTDKIQNAE